MSDKPPGCFRPKQLDNSDPNKQIDHSDNWKPFRVQDFFLGSVDSILEKGFWKKKTNHPEGCETSYTWEGIGVIK